MTHTVRLYMWKHLQWSSQGLWPGSGVGGWGGVPLTKTPIMLMSDNE